MSGNFMEIQERPEFGEIEPQPSTLSCEVETVVRSMKWRKVEGTDGVVVKMVEATGSFTIKIRVNKENI
ncbi:hypothetical protein E2C01_004320 [Portunus trituberculatus]|uniref:Uncharacterized protein n=1 Tax=Portunus trituberculatus TaxID=210409 RepID=A0A5B7CQE0_PORTR|nr:hypothetical protein [Portunus trituberculatus]